MTKKKKKRRRAQRVSIIKRRDECQFRRSAKEKGGQSSWLTLVSVFASLFTLPRAANCQSSTARANHRVETKEDPMAKADFSPLSHAARAPDMLANAAHRLKSNLLLKFFNDTYLSLPISQCYDVVEAQRNLTGKTTSGDNFNLCLVEWRQVALVAKNHTKQNSIDTNNNLHLEALAEGDQIPLADLIQDYPSKFLSFLQAQHTDSAPTSHLYDFDASTATATTNHSANFQFAKLTYLSTSLVLSLIGILANLLILTIIFINTKERYQHYFSCWYCCWWRMLGTGRGGHQYGSSASSTGSRSGARSIGASNGGGANSNCITSQHYLLLFQLTLTGLLLASYVLVDDINIYQVDRQAQIINDYEQALPLRKALVEQASHMLSTLEGNFLAFERQRHHDGSTGSAPWKLLTDSPLSIFLPPSPFESRRSLIELEQYAECEIGATERRRRRRRLSDRVQTRRTRFSLAHANGGENQLLRANKLYAQDPTLGPDNPILLLNLSSPSSRDPSLGTLGRVYLDVEYSNSSPNSGKRTSRRFDLSSQIGSIQVLKLNEQCDEHKRDGPQDGGPGGASFVSGNMMFNLIATIHLWIVALLAYDRYCAIAHPLEYLRSINTTRAKTFLTILWLVAIMLNVVFPIILSHVNWPSFQGTHPGGIMVFERTKSDKNDPSIPVCLSELWSADNDCREFWNEASTKFALLSTDLLANRLYSAESKPFNPNNADKNPHQASLSSILAIVISIANFLFIILIPLITITTCNISIYGIVKIHERRLSGSSGNGSLYHAKAMYLDRQNNCPDKIDTCSMTSSIVSRLIRASAQVGLISATLNGKHHEADQQSVEPCYCSWSNETQQEQNCSTAGSDLISFSPTKNYYLEDRADSCGGRVQQQPHRKDSIISQTNVTSNRSGRRLQAASANQQQQQQQDLNAIAQEHGGPLRQPCHSRPKQTLPERNHSSSLAASRRSSLTYSECCVGCGANNKHQCHHVHGAESCTHQAPMLAHGIKKQDSDGIMHQLKMAGLSFAGIAISDMAQAPDYHVASRPAKPQPQLHRSSSCSLWNLGSQVLSSSASTGACNSDCRRTNNFSQCAFNSSSHHRIQSNNSSQFSVNKCAQMHSYELASNRDYLPRRSYVSMNNNRLSLNEKYCTKVVDTDSENQYTLSSSIMGHSHRDHSAKGHYFSLGTKSNIFNAAVWMVMLLLIIAIPCYFIPIISHLFQLGTGTNSTKAPAEFDKLIEFTGYLLQLKSDGLDDELSGSLLDFHQQHGLEISQSAAAQWLAACFVWLSCFCRLLFLAMVPLHGWLYGIRSRSLKTTLKMVLRRYVSQKQATIEINQRRKSISSLRSRDSSLYCFAGTHSCHTGNHYNHCHCTQCHQQQHQHPNLARQHKNQFGASQSQEFSSRVFRRCASFNLTSVANVQATKEAPTTKTSASPPGDALTGGSKGIDLVLDRSQMVSIEMNENDKHNKSAPRQCNSIRFVIGDYLHEQKSDQQPALDDPPTPPKSLLTSFGGLLTPHFNGSSNSPSISGSRYSSQTSSLNSPLADSNRSLLSASIQSSQSAAFMLLSHQTTTNAAPQPEKPKLSGVLKKPQSNEVACNDKSKLSESRTKCRLGQIGRTKSLDCYQQQQSDSSPSRGRQLNGELANNTRLSSILKKFTANSVDATTTRNQAGDFFTQGQPSGPTVDSEPEQRSSDEDTTRRNSIGTKATGCMRKMSNDITFLLTSSDQSETKTLDLTDASGLSNQSADGHCATELSDVDRAMVRSESLDTGNCVNQIDETTEMLPGNQVSLCRNLTDANESAADDVSRVTSITETSSVRRMSESKIKQIRQVISRYLSGIVAKTSRQAPNVARRAYSINCNLNPVAQHSGYSTVSNPLFRQFSDFTTSTSSTIICARQQEGQPIGRKSSLDSGAKSLVGQQQQHSHCCRNKALLMRRKSTTCEHSTLDAKRRNSLSSPASSMNCTKASKPKRGDGNEYQDTSCNNIRNHQPDHHHLKPPNCLKLIFDPDSQPPLYSSALALSPIKECSSNHSYASSQSSLNNQLRCPSGPGSSAQLIDGQQIRIHDLKPKESSLPSDPLLSPSGEDYRFERQVVGEDRLGVCNNTISDTSDSRASELCYSCQVELH